MTARPVDPTPRPRAATHRAPSAAAAAALLTLLGALGLAPWPARAGSPAQYIFSPEVEQGEWEIDSKAGISRDRAGRSRWAGSLGVEYGLTRWWGSEVTLNFGREPGGNTRIDGLEWENRFQLWSAADGRSVVGWLFEAERARERDEGVELRYGPLLQRRFGAWQANLNLLLERRVRSDDPEPTTFHYQWQWRRPRASGWDLGLQGFGDLGRWDRWAPRREQSHILGPVLFGRFGDDESPAYEIGWLFGTGGAAPRHTLRLQAMVPF